MRLIHTTYFLKKKNILIVMLLLLFTPIINAQVVVDYTVNANIIYRFTKYIDWPDNTKKGDFIIGVIGNSPLYDELKNFTSNKTVGNQKIVVKKFSPSSASFDSQILFVESGESRNLKRIALQTEGTAILILSEFKGLAQKGSCINFVFENDHLKLEINKTNIQKRNLSIATDLLNL